MRTLAIVVLLAACGKGGDSTEAKSGSAGAAGSGGSGAVVSDVKPTAGFEKLTVTRDGKPIPMARAFIKRVSPDQWRLQVGDKVGSCQELLSGVASAVEGATSFVTTLRRRLAPDGIATIQVTEFWTGGHPTKATFSTARLTEPTDKDTRVEVELAKISDDDAGKILVVEGALVAIGCGDQPPDGAGIPKDSHVSAASVSVAGKKLDLVSAVLVGDDLTLSTGPKDCSGITPWSQVVVRHHAGKWTLSGTWFEKDHEATEKALPEDTVKDLKVTFGAQGNGKDGPTMAITIAGAGNIGPYPITLAGTIEALDCQTKK